MDDGAYAPAPTIVGQMVYQADELVARWVGKRLPQPWAYSPDMRALGVLCDGRLAAGVIYHSWNGWQVLAEIAATPGARWANRHTLFHLFSYPFESLGCERLTALVARENRASIRLVMKMGFTPEATLRGSAPDGGDMIVFAMFRPECRWIGGTYGQELESPEGA